MSQNYESKSKNNHDCIKLVLLSAEEGGRTKCKVGDVTGSKNNNVSLL